MSKKKLDSKEIEKILLKKTKERISQMEEFLEKKIPSLGSLKEDILVDAIRKLLIHIHRKNPYATVFTLKLILSLLMEQLAIVGSIDYELNGMKENEVKERVKMILDLEENVKKELNKIFTDKKLKFYESCSILSSLLFSLIDDSSPETEGHSHGEVHSHDHDFPIHNFIKVKGDNEDKEQPEYIR